MVTKTMHGIRINWIIMLQSIFQTNILYLSKKTFLISWNNDDNDVY